MENEITINGVTYVKKEEQLKKDDLWTNEYWYVDTDGGVDSSRRECIDALKPYCYPTEEAALKASEKMLALYTIKKYAEDTWGKFVPDWTNTYQRKYFIQCNVYEESNDFEVDFYSDVIYANTFYLKKKENCEEIIKKFDKELRIIFDV